LTRVREVAGLWVHLSAPRVERIAASIHGKQRVKNFFAMLVSFVEGGGDTEEIYEGGKEGVGGQACNPEEKMLTCLKKETFTMLRG